MSAKNTVGSKHKATKFIFVVGGVMSGVGKGVTTSTIALLMQARGFKVTAIKIDPYINVDAGTMNPTEHGEVFVLKDGLETDQDMGNYERFLNQDLPNINYMTTGSVYQSVIEKERNLGYGGKNVEVVPDIPLEIIGRIKKAAKVADADVVMVEVGGTVGEYQNILFLEAIRMMKSETPDDVMTVMVSYLPVPGSIGEMKTKPTQTAVRALNGVGVFADIIIARSSSEVDLKRKEKIARFCNVKTDCVISAPDVASIYDIPLAFEKEGLTDKICRQMQLSGNKKTNLLAWQRFVASTKKTKAEIKIAVVGKYFNSGDFVLSDVYLSVLEAIKYSAYALHLQPKISYLSAADFSDKKKLKELKGFAGILIPGGFGTTGVEGKLNVIRFSREQKIPYFGICYGMQLGVLEFAQNVLKLKDASTAEIDPKAKHLLIDIMPEQKVNLASGQLGGTMRLGEYQAVLKRKTQAAQAYKKTEITERHRHRYEVNPAYIDDLEKKGLIFSGTSADGKLMEIMELPSTVHPFFVGVQFHPELIARPLAPHPLFTAFIKAAYEHGGGH
ncbi:MAG TPA: CTP synthase [Candidatus Paceibacterota bacterium]|nr:CTP synthase [Candidatus Paceibacterota bacterium]HMO83214.1 CTP synthase [Candidatus Paceibacterota bacterium]